MKLLKHRSFELNSAVREMIDHHWKTLVNADIETRQFTIRKVIEGKNVVSRNATTTNRC